MNMIVIKSSKKIYIKEICNKLIRSDKAVSEFLLSHY